MGNLTSFPTFEEMRRHAERTPAHMRPSTAALAYIGEGYLTDAQCDEIIADAMTIEPYSINHCNAVTRELPPGEFDSLMAIEDFARGINNMSWCYDLDDFSQSWLQTYVDGGSYERHCDAQPGQVRKLTAVALLSDPNTYIGGELKFDYGPLVDTIPKTRGTIVVFQAGLFHRVTPLSGTGVRQTINMGFWGPSFV